MKKQIASLLFSLVLVGKIIFAQGEAAVPFLYVQESPQFIGAAQVGVAVPPIDPMGFYLNPAVLGETSREFNFTTLFLPSKVNWLGWENLEFSTFGMSLGYNFQESLLNLPLSIGVGFVKHRFDYGSFIYTGPNSPEPIGNFEPYDEFSSFSLGVSYDFYLRLSAGITFKNYESDLGRRIIDGKTTRLSTSGSTFDYGFLITAPISELYFDDLAITLENKGVIKPKTSISVGYSLSNIGDEVEYSGLEDQKDPLPRTARLGYNFNFGFDFVSKQVKFNLIDYFFIVEADDYLIDHDKVDFSSFSYQSGLGDINIGKQLVNLEATEEVVVRKAHMFRFLETVTLSLGRFDGRGFYPVRKTSGVAVSTTGLSKYLSANFDNEIIQFIADHISIEYYSSTLFKDWMFETEIEGVGIILKNFSF